MIQIDMEKPDHCLRCPMRGVDDECVLIRGSENFFGWEEQYANCPLREVEPESQWIPFEVRELTDEERERHPDWEWILDGDIPEDGQEILVSRGKWVTADTFYDEGECYLDGGWEIEEGMAWMPLPRPFREEGGEE